MFETNFALLDWVIVAVYLTASVAAGIAVNKFIHNVGDFMVGGRGSGAALNVATYIGTGLGLVTLMYASIDAFQNGFAYVTVALIGAGVGIFLGITGFVIAPLRDMALTTLPEFFEKRFDRSTRVLAGCICALAGILNMGLFPKMGATFITYATGLGASDDAALIVNIITTLLIVLVLIYTVLGGMVSVIVTDYIQFVVLSIGLAVGVYFCLSIDQLGWDNMTAALVTHHGEKAFNPVAEGSSYGWPWVGFNLMIFFAAGLCWAPEATRVLTARDTRAAKRTFLFAGPGQFIRLAIPALFAVAAFCYFSNHAELATHFFPDGPAGNIENAPQAMPLLLGKIIPTGILGLLVAGLLAAFMSTHDSYLLAWGSIITRDVIAPLKKREFTDKEQIRITRNVIILIGQFLLVWGLWYPLPDSVWNYMSITGTIYLSGAAVTVIGGLYWKRASSAGAKAAMCCGLYAITALFPGANPINVGFVTFILCAVAFVQISLMVPDPRNKDTAP